jgi:hypothetical protein
MARDDEIQAVKYRDDLSRILGKQIEITVLGRRRSTDVNPTYDPPMFKALVYSAAVCSARTGADMALGQLASLPL